MEGPLNVCGLVDLGIHAEVDNDAVPGRTCTST